MAKRDCHFSWYSISISS